MNAREAYEQDCYEAGTAPDWEHLPPPDRDYWERQAALAALDPRAAELHAGRTVIRED